MREELEVLTEQEANKKDLTLKFAGATADLIATKNLFDVYLKTKVLDVCGDALDNKENKWEVWCYYKYFVLFTYLIIPIFDQHIRIFLSIMKSLLK